MVRAEIPDLIEVFVDAPLEVCESRDPKGLYKRARQGLVQDMTGIDSPFEPPLNPTVTCYTDRETIAESTQKVLAAIESRRKTVEVVPVPASRRKTLAVDFDGVVADYDASLAAASQTIDPNALAPAEDLAESLYAAQSGEPDGTTYQLVASNGTPTLASAPSQVLTDLQVLDENFGALEEMDEMLGDSQGGSQNTSQSQ